MMKRSIIFLVILFALAAPLARASSPTLPVNDGGSGGGDFSNVQSGNSNSTTTTLEDPLQGQTFETLIKGIQGGLYKLVIPLAFIIIIWIGIQFLTANGNEEKIKKARTALLWTVVGLAVILIGSGFIDLIKDILALKDKTP